MKQISGYKTLTTTLITALFLVAALGMAGCDRSHGGPPHNAKEGFFIDGKLAGVEGVEYVTVVWSGITDRHGRFYYQEGEHITFSIGDVVFDRTRARSILTTVDIVGGSATSKHPKVLNMSRLLQSLDYDGNLINGITIEDSFREALSGISVDFSDPDFAESRNVKFIFAKLNSLGLFPEAEERGLVSAEDAQINLEETLAYLEELNRREPEPAPFAGCILAPLGNVVMFEGQSINFQASVSGGEPPYDYQWKLGDGKTSLKKDPGFLTFSPGTHTVEFLALDAEGAMASDVRKVTVLFRELDLGVPFPDRRDETAIVFITSPPRNTTISAGDRLNLKAEITMGNPPFRYYWVIDGQRNFSYLLDQKNVEFSTPGEYTISIFLRDTNGDDWVDRVKVTVIE
ncbi:MAG: hypothetical protein RRA35_13345 [Desulfomonilia bacterium]|nr:hypothetical protein [Desulfomonilia bacterium]